MSAAFASSASRQPHHLRATLKLLEAAYGNMWVETKEGDAEDWERTDTVDVMTVKRSVTLYFAPDEKPLLADREALRGIPGVTIEFVRDELLNHGRRKEMKLTIGPECDMGEVAKIAFQHLFNIRVAQFNKHVGAFNGEKAQLVAQLGLAGVTLPLAITDSVQVGALKLERNPGQGQKRSA